MTTALAQYLPVLSRHSPYVRDMNLMPAVLGIPHPLPLYFGCLLLVYLVIGVFMVVVAWTGARQHADWQQTDWQMKLLLFVITAMTWPWRLASGLKGM